jgi:chromosome segregation ATPase
MKKTLSNQKKVNQSNVKKTEMVDLELIDIENSIPGRAAYNQQALKEYTTKWKGGSNPPPVVLYTEDEKTFWVADGFHRIKSLKEANVEVNKIQAIVNRGGNREALLHALGANAEQGVRKTKKDKRHAVEIMLTDPEWVKWSNTVIARKVGVEETLVRSRRKAIFGLTDDTSEERMFFRNGAIHKQKVKTSRKSSQVASQPKEDGSDEDAQEQVKMLEFKISRLELTINQLEEENYEKKEEVKTLEQNNAILTQEKQLLEQQLERSHIIQLKAEANLKDQEINNLKNGYGILYKFAEEKLSEVEDLKHQLNNLHQQVENLKNQLSQ